MFLYGTGFMVPYTHLVYYAEAERGLEISGELTSLLGGGGAAGRLCFGLFSAVVRPSRLVLVVLLVTGASFICLPFLRRRRRTEDLLCRLWLLFRRPHCSVVFGYQRAFRRAESSAPLRPC